MNKKIIKVLESNFVAPESTKKDRFLNSLPYKNPTLFDFTISQLGYIRKRFWVLSILLMGVLSVFYFHVHIDKESVSILSAGIPVFTLLSVAEIYKSSAYNMVELEASCKYDLGRITLIRLGIIGSFQFVVIVILMLIFKDKTHFGNLRFIMYAITPFLLNTYISFVIANHFRNQDSLYICSGVTVMISFVIYLSNYYTTIYNDKYVLMWLSVITICTLLLVKEVYTLFNKRSSLWNLA